MSDLFSKQQLAQMAIMFGQFEKIDPSEPSYGKLIGLLDALDDGKLKQLAGAGIKFVSLLAENRVRRRERENGVKA